MAILVTGTVQSPFWEWRGRRYIEILDQNQKVFRVKVPFRYGRVMAHMSGLKTIQEFAQGDPIQVYLEKKLWGPDEYWVLISASEQ